jgi:4-amino-4-deoxy-L-arabinose transferase-like glycosyltransferase
MFRGVPRKKLTTLLGAFALLLLALALRLPQGELAEWKGDEAIQFLHARRIAREHVFPERGLPTTNGPRLGVHYLYVLALPVVFWDDPEAVRVFFALVSSLVIVAVYLFGRKELGEKPALAGAFLLACLPDEVRRGRWAWHPNLVPILATIVLLLVLRARRNPRGWAGGGLLALAPVLPVVHYALFGVSVAGFVFGLLAWKENRRASLAGLGLGLLLLAPHIAIEARSGFEATRGALSETRKERSDDERRPLVFPGLVLDTFSLENYAHAASVPASPYLFPLSLLVRGLLLFGLLLALSGFKTRSLEPSGTCLVLALAAWAPFLVLGLPARPHYVETAVPALVCLAGLAATRITPALLLPIGVGSVLAVSSVLGFAQKRAIPGGSDYDLPYSEKRAVCALALERELEVEKTPRFEYQPLLEIVWRSLPREKRDRFDLVPQKVSYWDLEYAVPRPKKPRGRVEIVVLGGEAALKELP